MCDNKPQFIEWERKKTSVRLFFFVVPKYKKRYICRWLVLLVTLNSARIVTKFKSASVWSSTKNTKYIPVSRCEHSNHQNARNNHRKKKKFKQLMKHRRKQKQCTSSDVEWPFQFKCKCHYSIRFEPAPDVYKWMFSGKNIINKS